MNSSSIFTTTNVRTSMIHTVLFCKGGKQGKNIKHQFSNFKNHYILTLLGFKKVYTLDN